MLNLPMHDGYEEKGTAFAIPDLWEKSPLADFEQYENGSSAEPGGTPFAPLQSMRDPLGFEDRKLEGTPDSSCYLTTDDYFSTSFPFPPAKDLDLDLPNLASFEYGLVESLEHSGLSSASSITGSISSFSFQEQEEEDIWSSTQILDPGPVPAELKSWERFHDKTSRELRTAYVSEGGPSVFDAALILHSPRSHADPPKKSVGLVLQYGPMLKSLLHLGIGRESLFYRWVDQEGSFRPHAEDGRISGFTTETFQSLAVTFIGYGNQMRSMQSFIDKSYHTSKPFPSLIAVADGFSKILTTLQAHLSRASGTIRSLLQAQYLFARPGLVLSCLSDMGAIIQTARSDEDLLSKLYSFVQELEHSTTWIRRMAFRILAHASRAWLESVRIWIGLKAELGFVSQNSRGNFIKLSEGVRNDEDGKEAPEVDLDSVSGSMPSFITNEDAQIILETGVGLRLLQNHIPEHPLGRPEALSSVELPTLEWRFSWQDIERIQAQAKDYESTLLDVIREFNISKRSVQAPRVDNDTLERESIGPFGVSLETIQEDFDISVLNLEKPPPAFGPDGDRLSETVDHCITLGVKDVEDEAALFAPPLTLVPLLSFSPVLTAQARLINQACLRLLFKEHKLRLHFSLQHRYHFFGDGIFASRLSHALFDPELQTAERRNGQSRSGVSGVSGLKLGSRDNWPPASSELRLALMGILSESYYHNLQAEGSSSHRAELPGGLSFAIREMPEDELQRCLDPDSIEALDFLRLQYRPPPPLDVVITVSSLTKYDSIFKLLLRAVRMMFVVDQLHRGKTGRPSRRYATVTQRFTIEAHHFVSATCGYFFDGVTDNWAIFERKLRKIERDLDGHDIGDADSIHLLRKYHEKILDRIMFALILRKRQEQVMKLLEEIFNLILRFASSLRSDATDEAEGEEKEKKVAEIYETFRKKVRVFISVCRGLSERRGQGGSKRHDSDDDLFVKEDADEDGGNTIGRLLLTLEMNGYYSKPATR